MVVISLRLCFVFQSKYVRVHHNLYRQLTYCFLAEASNSSAETLPRASTDLKSQSVKPGTVSMAIFSSGEWAPTTKGGL